MNVIINITRSVIEIVIGYTTSLIQLPLSVTKNMWSIIFRIEEIAIKRLLIGNLNEQINVKVNKNYYKRKSKSLIEGMANNTEQIFFPYYLHKGKLHLSNFKASTYSLPDTFKEFYQKRYQRKLIHSGKNPLDNFDQLAAEKMVRNWMYKSQPYTNNLSGELTKNKLALSNSLMSEKEHKQICLQSAKNGDKEKVKEFVDKSCQINANTLTLNNIDLELGNRYGIQQNSSLRNKNKYGSVLDEPVANCDSTNTNSEGNDNNEQFNELDHLRYLVSKINKIACGRNIFRIKNNMLYLKKEFFERISLNSPRNENDLKSYLPTLGKYEMHNTYKKYSDGIILRSSRACQDINTILETTLTDVSAKEPFNSPWNENQSNAFEEMNLAMLSCSKCVHHGFTETFNQNENYYNSFAADDSSINDASKIEDDLLSENYVSAPNNFFCSTPNSEISDASEDNNEEIYSKQVSRKAKSNPLYCERKSSLGRKLGKSYSDEYLKRYSENSKQVLSDLESWAEINSNYEDIEKDGSIISNQLFRRNFNDENIGVANLEEQNSRSFHTRKDDAQLLVKSKTKIRDIPASLIELRRNAEFSVRRWCMRRKKPNIKVSVRKLCAKFNL